MKTLIVTAVWESVHEVEVPDDYDVEREGDDVILNQIDCRHAGLVDWMVDDDDPPEIVR